MASRAQRAAARRNIKKAQAALRAKGRRGKSHKSRAKKAVHRHTSKAMHRRQNKAMFPEAGRWARAYRVLDIVTSSIQNGILHHGATREAFMEAKQTALGVDSSGHFALAN